jgi:hypothetical protein
MKKIAGWRGRFLSLAARVVLIKSCLASILVYLLSFIKFPKWAIKMLNTHMGNFLWDDSMNNHRYHLANWELVSMCKEFGGLGVPSLRDLNICLLASWFKRYSIDRDNLWKEVVDFKYDTLNPNIFLSRTSSASSFFKGFMWAAQAAKMGYFWKVGNGRKIGFWEDNWLGSSSLAIQFWPIYRIINEHGKTIAELWDGHNLRCTFRRNVNETLYNSWLELVELVSTIQLSGEEDEMVCKFSSKGTYSSQSLYKVINFRGIKQVHVSPVWGIKVPPRVHMFLWPLIHNRTLTRVNLAQHRKVDDVPCLFCDQEETCQHLFFDCAVASRCWIVISELFGFQVGMDIISIGKFWLSHKKNSLVNMITVAVVWSVWKLRNELCFQKIGWRNMDVLFYQIHGLLQNWKVLCLADKRGLLENFLRDLKTSTRMVSWLPDILRREAQSSSEA